VGSRCPRWAGGRRGGCWWVVVAAVDVVAISIATTDKKRKKWGCARRTCAVGSGGDGRGAPRYPLAAHRIADAAIVVVDGMEVAGVVVVAVILPMPL
jgi:hypothetical protein